MYLWVQSGSVRLRHRCIVWLLLAGSMGKKLLETLRSYFRSRTRDKYYLAQLRFFGVKLCTLMYLACTLNLFFLEEKQRRFLQRSLKWVCRDQWTEVWSQAELDDRIPVTLYTSQYPSTVLVKSWILQDNVRYAWKRATEAYRDRSKQLWSGVTLLDARPVKHKHVFRDCQAFEISTWSVVLGS